MSTPTFSYTCEICGLEGMSDEGMRAHTMACHIEGQPTCPFCDLSDVTADEMLTHVNQAHLDYLTPEAELMAFIDDQSPGFEDDPKTLTDSCSYNTPNSVANGWHTPSQTVTPTSMIGHSSRYDSHSSIATLAGSRNSLEVGGVKSKKHQTMVSSNSKETKCIKLHKEQVFVNGTGESSSSSRNFNATSNGAKSKQKSKPNSRQTSVEGPISNGRQSGNTSGSDYELSPASSKVSLAGAGQGSPLRSQLALKLKTNAPKKLPVASTPMLQCLMCPATYESPNRLEEHINRAHFDLTSPSLASLDVDCDNPTAGLEQCPSRSSLRCPLCDNSFVNGSDLELHVNIEHKDILSPQKQDNATSNQEATVSNGPLICPVCCQSLPPHATHQDLTQHVEEHFEGGLNDNLNHVMTDEEREAQKDREEREFQLLRAQYGMDEEENGVNGTGTVGAGGVGGTEGAGYAGGAARGLRRALAAGRLSVADYYERRVGLRRSEAAGRDDNTSCTTGLLSRITALSVSDPSVVSTHMCSASDHYASTYADRGWGCGYRNMQMLVSSLLQHTAYNERLYDGIWTKHADKSDPDGVSPPRTAVPSISRLQLMVEKAWDLGFDIQGCEQLGCKLYNTRKWIGACEVVTVLSSLRIRCQLIDFHRPTSQDGSHPQLFDWVLKYFRDNADDFKPPLYLQHQGHSRTIVGCEYNKDGSVTLLVFDPSHSPAQVRQVCTGGGLRGIRRGSGVMRARQYQLVAVTGLIDSDTEYDASKVLRSVRIPQDR